jgi:hypothetical protein
MRSILIALTLLIATPVLAAPWGSYENARFGYILDIPPGYEGEGEADNGDGQIFTPASGTQLLRVYGGNALDGFEETVKTAMGYARDDGWNLSYERVTPRWASFSGTKNGMIVYARAISLCGGDQYASFELQYPKRDLEKMNPVVERLVASFEATGDGASC